MCAIFGIVRLKGSPITDKMMIDIVDDLFSQAEQRGRTSAGVAVVSNKEIKVIKKNIQASSFIQRKEYKSFMSEAVSHDDSDEGTLSIIGHCRYRTKGSELNNDNNHPIITDSMVGVHNGNISNDDLLFDIFSSGEINKNNTIKRKAQVDSEIIFRLFEYYVKTLPVSGDVYRSAIKMINKKLLGSYACATVHKKLPHVTWIFRHSNPAEINYYKDEGIVIYASIAKYIDFAVAGRQIGDATPITLLNDEAIGIDAINNKMVKFNMSLKV